MYFLCNSGGMTMAKLSLSQVILYTSIPGKFEFAKPYHNNWRSCHSWHFFQNVLLRNKTYKYAYRFGLFFCNFKRYLFFC